jgi:hypothetical protein
MGNDVVDLEREKNVKEHGPLGALLETAAERGPDEIEVMGRVYELVKGFDATARRAMWHWIEARIKAENTHAVFQEGEQ